MFRKLSAVALVGVATGTLVMLAGGLSNRRESEGLDITCSWSRTVWFTLKSMSDGSKVILAMIIVALVAMYAVSRVRRR